MESKIRGRGQSSYTPEQVARVLVGSGITIQSEVDTDYIIFCPFHNNTRTPAGEVDKKTGLFFCFSCHHISELTELVMHQTGKTYFQSLRFIKGQEKESNILDEINKNLVVKEMYEPFSQEEIDRLNLNAKASKRAVDYLHTRKISLQSINKFMLGYSEKRDMITIPVHSPDGIPVGFVGRSVEGKDFKNTPNLPKSKVLFNLHRVKSSRIIYVVESSFDAIRLDQCGFAAVAVLGSNVSNIQIDLLKKYFNDIIVIADNDMAGKNMADKLVEKLGPKVSVLSLDSKYKDIGDMTDEEIKTINIDFNQSIYSMLV